jgi:hypothetical protein
MAERSDVYTYFWVEGFPDQCETITAQMRLTPSEVRRAGEALPFGKIAETNLWKFHSPLPRGEHLIQESLEALLSVLEERSEVVGPFASRHSAGINCVGYFYGSNPGLSLSANLVERLAALRLAVDFDLYNYAEEDAD